MKYYTEYNSPLGKLTMASNGESLTGLWIENQKYYADGIENDAIKKDLPIFKDTKKWLDIYFNGSEPNFTPKICFENVSNFRKNVNEIMLKIPYGETLTYGEIAKILENQTNKKVSAQAVGNAVGHNLISIIIPCHRVVGKNKALVGYAGGIDKKLFLLKLENPKF